MKHVPVGIQIRRARIAKGYSRRALGNACGMRDETIRSIEIGRTKHIHAERLMKLEDVLGVVLDFGDEKVEKEPIFSPNEYNKMRLDIIDEVMTLDNKHLRFILSTIKEI